jgi:putative glycosyltransferase (TIGR04372 family)
MINGNIIFKVLHNPRRALTILTNILKGKYNILKGVYLGIVILLLKPFINIIIAPTPIRGRFGQMVSAMSHYAAAKDSGLFARSIEIFYFGGSDLYNSFLKKVYSRNYIIIDYQTARIAKYFINKNNSNFLKTKINIDHDLNNVLSSTYPNITFTKEEVYNGEEFLDKLPRDHKGIICLSLKEKSYYKKHDHFSNYPMSENEFGEIDKYKEAVEYFIKEGYLVLRMGSSNSEHLNIENRLFYDYANSGFGTDFLDVYIASKCCFHFTNQTGFANLGITFRKPVFMTNCRHFINNINNYPFSMMIFNKYFSLKKQKHLTFREIFETEKKVFRKGRHYAHAIDSMNKMGVIIEKENAKEIAYFAKEVMSYHDNELVLTENDLSLQKKLWQQYIDADFNNASSYNNPDDIYLKISPHFLRKNEWMLD